MKNKSLLFIFLLLLNYTSIRAQALVAEKGIDTTDANFRVSSAMVLGQVTMNIPSNGKVVVRFDGLCIADSGDRIVLAASNTTTFGIDDANISLEVVNNESGRRSFSHTRAYDVTAGINTFYAVGQNYVDESGSGIASVYGALAVEFFPASGSILLADSGFSFSGNVRDSSTPVAQVALDVPSSGTVIVHFDGQVVSDPGDIIVLAASNTSEWGVDDGNVSEIAAKSNINITPFSHTRAYDVTPGNYNFYAVAQNYVETNGSGNISVYANLTAEFFPTNGAQIDSLGRVDKVNVNLRQASPVIFDSITINAPSQGYALVTFDGTCNSTPGDRIVFGASNDGNWSGDTGNIAVISPAAGIYVTNIFSHTRLFSVTAGSNSFYAVGQNYLDTSGTGIASVYGSLVVKYYPAIVSGITEVKAGSDFNLFPNPAQNQLTIIRTFNGSPSDVAQITDVTGKIIRTINFGTPVQTTIDISSFAAGTYLVNLNGAVKLFTRQ